MQHLLLKLSRGEIPQGRMNPLVHVDIFDKSLYMNTSIMNVFILMKINFLLLKSSYEPFCISILPGPPLPAMDISTPASLRRETYQSVLHPIFGQKFSS